MIEVLRQATGKFLLSAGAHSVECDADDDALDEAIKALSEKSGVERQRIAIMVARATL